MHVLLVKLLLGTWIFDIVQSRFGVDVVQIVQNPSVRLHGTLQLY